MDDIGEMMGALIEWMEYKDKIIGERKSDMVILLLTSSSDM